MCWKGAELLVREYGVDDGAVTGEARVAQRCGPGWDYGPRVELLAGTRAVILALPDAMTLVRVDLASGAVVTREVPPGASPSSVIGPELAMALSPTGERLATVGRDHALRQWSARDLTELAPALEAGSSPANENIYAPSFRISPLAYSPDGDLLAYLDPAGSVVLRRVIDGVVTARLTPIEPDPSMPASRRGNAPVRVTFERHQRFVAVEHERGVALWTCASTHWPAPSAGLGVSVSGPTRVVAGAPSTWVATPSTDRDVVAYRLFVDDALVGAASTARELRWTPTLPGRHRLRVAVDDGVNTGSAALDIDVTAGP